MAANNEIDNTVTCGLCKNCEHWSGDKWDQMRTCECPSMDIGYQGKPSNTDNDGVLIEGDEGWGWFTGPEFGCIHFKFMEN